MEHMSKRSYLGSSKTFNQTLTRGHTSEIADIKRRGGHRSLLSRRTFTFKGTQAKRQTEHTSKTRIGHTPSSVHNVSQSKRIADSMTAMTCTKRARSTSKVRTPASTRSRSRSAVRHTATNKQPPSRVGSSTGSPHGSRHNSSLMPAATAGGGGGIALLAESNLAVAPSLVQPLPPPPPTEFELKDVLVTRDALSADGIVTEESKLVSSPNKSTDSEEDADDDPTKPNVTIEVPRSPSMVAFRKVMYNETENKWIAHYKLEEDPKRAREKKKRAEMVCKKQCVEIKPHKVKGCCTAKMQVMFPTAMIKQDRRSGFLHHIEMTDPLRLELYKRNAPIVPTFFQEHILKFGKLPFRNNPRPHPVV